MVAASRLVCPKDYEEEKFNKILMLYDKLDKNGDHTVDENELSAISQLHVKNQLNMLENMKNPLINEKKSKYCQDGRRLRHKNKRTTQ